VLCGLPFQLLAYLFSMPLAAIGRLIQIHSPGAGWYVVCVAVVLRGIALIPTLRYKEKPLVDVPPSGESCAGHQATRFKLRSQKQTQF
jgi:hypothetical protein